MQERQLSFFIMYLSTLTSKVYLLVNFFFLKLHIIFILQWISFILGKIKRRTSRHVACKRDNSYFLGYVLIFLSVQALPFG